MRSLAVSIFLFSHKVSLCVCVSECVCVKRSLDLWPSRTSQLGVPWVRFSSEHREQCTNETGIGNLSPSKQLSGMENYRGRLKHLNASWSSEGSELPHDCLQKKKIATVSTF